MISAQNPQEKPFLGRSRHSHGVGKGLLRKPLRKKRLRLLNHVDCLRISRACSIRGRYIDRLCGIAGSRYLHGCGLASSENVSISTVRIVREADRLTVACNRQQRIRDGGRSAFRSLDRRGNGRHIIASVHADLLRFAVVDRSGAVRRNNFVKVRGSNDIAVGIDRVGKVFKI